MGVIDKTLDKTIRMTDMRIFQVAAHLTIVFVWTLSMANSKPMDVEHNAKVPGSRKSDSNAKSLFANPGLAGQPRTVSLRLLRPWHKQYETEKGRREDQTLFGRPPKSLPSKTATVKPYEFMSYNVQHLSRCCP